MKNITIALLALSLSLLSLTLSAQGIYRPEADAPQELKDAIALAKKQNKHVLVQVGGNWCSWCLKFHKLSQENDSLRSAIEADYVVVKINTSKENKNLDVLKRLEYPQRFGFPVFVILDGDGKRLHTQNSSYLEAGSNYDVRQVLRFLQHWNVGALDGGKYLK